MKSLLISVDGVPVPQGSMKAFVNKWSGRAAITSDNPKLKAWRTSVTVAAKTAMTGEHFDTVDGPVRLYLVFALPRPKVLGSKAAWHLKKPDLDKLVRAVGDALTDAEVYADDSRVVAITASKQYESDLMRCGVLIHVTPLDPEAEPFGSSPDADEEVAA